MTEKSQARGEQRSPVLGGSVGRFRNAMILALLVTVAIGVVGNFLLPGLAKGATAETLEEMRKGAWVGYGLGGFLSLVLALRVARVRLDGKDPMVPMILGFLGKLILIALGAILIRGPLESLGDYRAFAIAFVLSVLSFQTVYYPLQERRMNVDRTQR